MNSKPMRIVGLLGGIASGKSFVARELERLGAGLLDADQTAHLVLELPSIKEAIYKKWGKSVFKPDGKVDRCALADRIFAPPPSGYEDRQFLEQLTHPEIKHRLLEQAQRMAAEGKTILVLDAPLLLEAGWDKVCNTLVFVDAPYPVRLARALQRGWSEQQFLARESTQEPLEEKRKRADVVLDNSGPPEQTRAHIERFWRSLAG